MVPPGAGVGSLKASVFFRGFSQARFPLGRKSRAAGTSRTVKDPDVASESQAAAA